MLSLLFDNESAGEEICRENFLFTAYKHNAPAASFSALEYMYLACEYGTNRTVHQ